MRRFHPILFLFLIVGALAALIILSSRHLTESHNRTVELTVDYGSVVVVAAASGTSVPDALRELRQAGATSVAMTEETLSDLVADGAVDLGQERGVVNGTAARVARLRFADPALFDRVARNVRHRLNPRVVTDLPDGGAHVELSAPGPREDPSRAPIFLRAPWEAVRSVGVGLPPEDVAWVRGAGLGIVGRTDNFTGARADSIRWILEQLKQSGAHLVIFSGEEVLGQKAHLKDTARALEETGLLYGSVEMGKQRGDAELSRALKARIVRVHAIPAAELVRLAPATAIERFVRATRERNIRVCYLRLFTFVTDDPLAANLDFVRGIAAELRDRGYQPGVPAPFDAMALEEGPAGRILSALVGLLVVAGGVMLLGTLVPICWKRQFLPALLLGVAAVALAAVSPGLGRKVLALGGAIVFPVLAFALFPLRRPAFSSAGSPPGSLHPDAQREKGVLLTAILARFIGISFVTLLGAIAVAGLLSGRPAMVKVSEFSGIKLAQTLPLLAVGAIYAADLLAPAPDWAARRRAATARLAWLFGEPLRLWHALLGLGALAVLVLLLLRSGNDPGVGVSDLELKFRSLMDQILVRPRTKEFLFGHPALVVALMLWVTGRAPGAVAPLVVAGAVGQAGMVNSFCHLHTPIALTLARTWNGLWLGFLIGLAVAFLWLRLLGRERTSVEPGAERPAAEEYPSALSVPGAAVPPGSGRRARGAS